MNWLLGFIFKKMEQALAPSLDAPSRSNLTSNRGNVTYPPSLPDAFLPESIWGSARRTHTRATDYWGIEMFLLPNDQTLTPPEPMTEVPHETAGVMRMHRHGMTPEHIANILKISKTQLMHEMNLAIDDETQASCQFGRDIHDEDLKAVKK